MKLVQKAKGGPNDNKIEKELGRRLNEDEKAIAEVWGEDLQGVAFICIQEGVTVKAARRLAARVQDILKKNAEFAARLAAEMVKAERLSPGIISEETKPRH